jgi:hypothetical protein
MIESSTKSHKNDDNLYDDDTEEEQDNNNDADNKCDDAFDKCDKGEGISGGGGDEGDNLRTRYTCDEQGQGGNMICAQGRTYSKPKSLDVGGCQMHRIRGRRIRMK